MATIRLAQVCANHARNGIELEEQQIVLTRGVRLPERGVRPPEDSGVRPGVCAARYGVAAPTQGVAAPPHLELTSRGVIEETDTNGVWLPITLSTNLIAT